MEGRGNIKQREKLRKGQIKFELEAPNNSFSARFRLLFSPWKFENLPFSGLQKPVGAVYRLIRGEQDMKKKRGKKKEKILATLPKGAKFVVLEDKLYAR